MKVKKRNLVLVIGLILVICFFYIGIKSTRTSASLSDVYIENTYSLNEEFTAPEAKIIIEDTEYIASALLKYPSGNVRNATRAVLNESGKYTLEYKLLKNNKNPIVVISVSTIVEDLIINLLCKINIITYIIQMIIVALFAIYIKRKSNN